MSHPKSRRALSALIAVTTLCLSAPALAADARGKVLELAVDKSYGNFVFIRVETPPSPALACSTHAYWQYTLPLSTDTEKRIFAMLVTAQTTGRPVDVFGAGTCTELSTIESAKGARLFP